MFPLKRRILLYGFEKAPGWRLSPRLRTCRGKAMLPDHDLSPDARRRAGGKACPAHRRRASPRRNRRAGVDARCPGAHGPRPCCSSLRRKCNRALAIPWAGQERHAAAGLLAHGSSRGTNLPGPRMILRPAQWLHPDVLAGCPCIALAAHSCRDSPVSDRMILTMFPIKPLRAPMRVEGRCLRPGSQQNLYPRAR